MAVVKNQFGTFETDKKLGSKRLPSNADLENKAQKLYGKSFDDLTIQQRTKLRTGARGAMSIADTVTFEQYLDDYKNMAADPNYIPKYIKPNLGSGMSAQQKRARAEAKNSIEAFEQKFQKNVNKRKRLKRAADPIKREKDLTAKAERRVNRRIKKKDVALTDREKKLNLEQRTETRKLNEPIRNNPKLVLGNKDLMEKLSITVSKEGDIVKVPTGLTEQYLKERGLFEIDHQRDIYKKGRGKNLPANRNLIAGPYNRAGGFKEMAEKFIESNPNPNDPKVKNILKTAEDIQVTLQPNVDDGIFPTKSLGFKQIADPVEKFQEVSLKWNNDIGAIVETNNPDFAVKNVTEDLKIYADENPIPVDIDTKPPKTSPTVLKTIGKTLAKVGAPLPTALIDSYFVGQQVKDGKSTAEIAQDPMNWIGLAAMEPLSKVSGIAESGKLNAALRLGLNPSTIRGISRFAGLPGLAVSTAMTAYDQYKKYQNEEGFIYNLFNKEEK